MLSGGFAIFNSLGTLSPGRRYKGWQVRLLFMFRQAKAIKRGVMVHGVHSAVGHGQSAEVDPTAHSVAALVKDLAGFGVERAKNGIVGVQASLLVGQQL